MNLAYSVPQMTLLLVGFLMYVVAAALGIGHLVSRNTIASRLGRVLAGGGLLAHAAFLLVLAVSARSLLPVTTHFESIVFGVSVLVLAALLVDAAFRLPAVTDFVLPLVPVFLAVAALFVRIDRQTGATPEAFWLSAHIALTLLSFAAFTLGFIFGVMFLTLEHQLKAKRMGWLFDLLPPLEVVDRLSARVVVGGFALLTLGILLGMLGAHLQEETAVAGWKNDPKVVASMVTWVVYLLTAHLRLYPRYRGRKTTYLTVLGFLFVLFTYFGTSMLGAGFHRF